VVDFPIVIGPLAEEELNGLRTYDHRAIRDAIAVHLSRDPLSASRHRKRLSPPPAEIMPELEIVFEGQVPEVWQLRVGSWRVIYVVTDGAVFIVRVVKKGRQTTGRALS
jgi:mRNA-degrading endonuclease RelE of RelBE toxin-antitoxin system